MITLFCYFFFQWLPLLLDLDILYFRHRYYLISVPKQSAGGLSGDFCALGKISIGHYHADLTFINLFARVDLLNGRVTEVMGIAFTLYSVSYLVFYSDYVHALVIAPGCCRYLVKAVCA